MVDILIAGAIAPVKNDLNNRDNPRRPSPRKKVIKNRRKARADRRTNVRNGVIVTLSKYPERRRGGDRRKKQG